MRLALVVISIGLSLHAQAQIAAVVKSATKTGAKNEGLALFKAGASKTVSMAAAKESGVVMKVWEKNSVLVHAEKGADDNVRSVLMRVEKMNSKTPRYEEKLISTLNNIKSDGAKLGVSEAKISRIEVEEGRDAAEDGAKMIRVYFDKGVDNKAGDKFLKDLESRLSGTDRKIIPAETRGFGNQ